MRAQPFKLERFFALHEFTARFLLSASDCETLSLKELLALTDARTLALWEGMRFSYTESPGHPLLREEAAGLYETVSSGQILVAVPEEAIFLLMHALLKGGDHAVVVTPAYQSLYELAAEAGADVTRMGVEAGADGWRLDLGALERAIEPRTRLLVVNFPHNPTGYLPDRREFEAIVDIARARGLYLLSDEMYRLMEHDPAVRLPAACDVYERAVTLSGLSKAFGLPGLRVGWLATRDSATLNRCAEIKDYTTICHSAPSEILAIAALRARDAIVARNRAIVLRNLETARAFFHSRPDLFRWLEPRGGPIAFPEWTGAGTVEEFCAAALENRGVLVAPGSLFDAPGNHFRIGLGRSNLPEGLEELNAHLKDAGT